jgi:hypothetical protein
MTDGRRRVIAASFAMLLGGVFVPQEVLAADTIEVQSRSLFKKGEALANDGQWSQACPLFRAAHDLHGTGGTALRTADCYEKLGQFDRALEMYRYIVDHGTTDKEPERVRLAEDRVAVLKKQLKLDQPAPAPAGTQTAPTSAPPPSSPPPPPPPPPPNRVPAFIAFGVGIAGAAVGGVLGGLALSEAHAVKTSCMGARTAPPYNCPGLASDANAATTKAWISNVGFGLAVAGAAAGVVLLVTIGSPKAQAAVKSAAGPGGLTLRF